MEKVDLFRLTSILLYICALRQHYRAVIIPSTVSGYCPDMTLNVLKGSFNYMQKATKLIQSTLT